MYNKKKEAKVEWPLSWLYSCISGVFCNTVECPVSSSLCMSCVWYLWWWHRLVLWLAQWWQWCDDGTVVILMMWLTQWGQLCDDGTVVRLMMWLAQWWQWCDDGTVVRLVPWLAQWWQWCDDGTVGIMLLGLSLDWYIGDGDDNNINNGAVIGTIW